MMIYRVQKKGGKKPGIQRTTGREVEGEEEVRGGKREVSAMDIRR